MSKHNYSQYSNKKNNKSQAAADLTTSCKPAAEVIDKTPVVVVEEPAVVEVKMVEETVETVSMPKTVIGIVANCERLNIRVEPDKGSSIVCQLKVDTEMEIDLSKSTDEWFHICTAAGIEGFCMRKFVNAKL